MKHPISSNTPSDSFNIDDPERLQRIAVQQEPTGELALAQARQVQQARFDSTLVTNANMGPAFVNACCKLDERLEVCLDERMERLGYSHRGHDKVLRISRTIADLAGRLQIEKTDVMEALHYRQLDRQVPFGGPGLGARSGL